jgi:hypothetical protein
MTIRAAVLAMVIALAGCSLLQPLQEQPAAVDEVVGEALAATRAPVSEQKAALSRAQKAFASDASSINRLRLATLLAALPAPLRDDARAAELLEPLSDAATPGVGRFSALLAAQVGERQRLARELDRAVRAERERVRADGERDKREEALREQLEALRSIERGILEREERLRRKPR